MDNTIKQHTSQHHFTIKILIGMLLGVLVGLALKWMPMPLSLRVFFADDILQTGGTIFIRLITMMVMPIVLVSLVCGASSLGNMKELGRIGGKAVMFYLMTTAVAITVAMLIASSFNVGHGLDLGNTQSALALPTFSLKKVIIDMFPMNPFKALSNGIMLQIIVFSLLFGAAITVSGEPGKKVIDLFQAVNEVLMKLIVMIMKVAPYGVFCLLAALFAKVGFKLIFNLAEYFSVVLLVLMIQLFFVYGSLLKFLGRLSVIQFFRNMYGAMIFAFSISSSNASIPVVLRTVKNKLGVSNSVASFIIPLGSTINMDGTAIMQGVATVFIANAYGVSLGLTGYLIVILMATLASIGTAGVPSVGLITLSMVLRQVGLPVEGIALIIGVDRLLDMTRTAVNIAGDSMIACLVAKSEKLLDQECYDAQSE